MFYETSWNRALEFFDKYNIKATFFVVGNELENSDAIQKIIFKASQLGHEIENHTYSHPFGLANLSDDTIDFEIKKCNEIVAQIIGTNPIGFRSPGYSISSMVINILKQNGIKYDSSGFWSVMNPILQTTHKLFFKGGLKNEGFGCVTRKLKQMPYSPHAEDWLIENNSDRTFFELPLPRTKIFALPFYNNFNLWAPTFYRNFISKIIKKKYIIYLFHIIEFMDLSDDIPLELNIHPNLKIRASKKIKSSDYIITNLLKHHTLIKTCDLVLGL